MKINKLTKGDAGAGLCASYSVCGGQSNRDLLDVPSSWSILEKPVCLQAQCFLWDIMYLHSPLQNDQTLPPHYPMSSSVSLVWREMGVFKVTGKNPYLMLCEPF